jgi:hypothetical protein
VPVSGCISSQPTADANAHVGASLCRSGCTPHATIEVGYTDKVELSCERLLGRNRHRIDYRHVISLRKLRYRRRSE